MTGTLFPVESAVKPVTTSHAVFSEDRIYRYSLLRQWEPNAPWMMFIGLNPSTADETNDDPTIRRCMGFARREGCGTLVMANLFAFRATDPAVMKAHPEPVGPESDERLARALGRIDHIVAAWGVHGTHLGRDREVAEICKGRLLCLGTTKEGHPRHPLYVRGDAPLVPFGRRGC